MSRVSIAHGCRSEARCWKNACFSAKHLGFASGSPWSPSGLGHVGMPVARSAYSPSVCLIMHQGEVISRLCLVHVKTKPGNTHMALGVCLVHGHTVGRPSCAVAPLSRSQEGSCHMECRHVERKDGLLSREKWRSAHPLTCSLLSFTLSTRVCRALIVQAAC